MIALLRLSAGLIGWATAFCLIYALHGLACAGGWRAARWVLAAAWGLSLAVTLGIALWLSRRPATLLDRASAATGWAGFVATLVTFAPLIGVPPCL